MKLEFKTTHSDGLYSYRFVSGHERHAANTSDEEIARLKKSDMQYPSTLLGTKMSQYMSLASFLLAQKEKYVLLRDAPDLHVQESIRNPLKVTWRYEIIADDFNGTGVDNGFVPSKFPYLVYYSNSLSHVEMLPEEIFEEEYSNVSIFGLTENATQRLRLLFDSPQAPSLKNFLKPGEVFIDLVCGKQYGYFNAFLAKSKNRLDDEFSAFENLTDTGN